MDEAGLIPISRLNVTEIANLHDIVGEINRCIIQLQNEGDAQVAEVLRDIGLKVLTDPRMEKRERKKAIKNVKKLAQEAIVPSRIRKPGAVRRSTSAFMDNRRV